MMLGYLLEFYQIFICGANIYIYMYAYIYVCVCVCVFYEDNIFLQVYYTDDMLSISLQESISLRDYIQTEA